MIICSRCFREGDELVQAYVVSGQACARCGELSEKCVRISTCALDPVALEPCQPKAVDPPTT